MLRKFILIAFIVTTAFACSGNPDSFESVSERAEKGDSVAQYKLGKMLISGKGWQRDVSGGEAWFMKAAQQGEIEAQKALALLYITEEVEGSSVNRAQTFKWLETVATQGDAEAQRLLGFMYAGGIGVAKDEVKSIKWIQQSASDGNTKAQLSVSNLYRRGTNGVASSEELAIEWALKAARQGDPYAQRELGAIYSSRGSPDPKERALRKEKSKEWNIRGFETFKILAESGDVDAQYVLGSIYFYGIEGFMENIDRKKSFHWYLKAAEQGHGYAQYAVGEAYDSDGIENERNYGVKRDETKAIEWYKKAAGEGVEEAQNILNSDFGVQNQ